MTSVDPAGPEFHLLQRAVAGRYSLVRELGRGGMGIVFLAREVSLDRLVAIKLLPPALAANPGLRERFLREARTAAQLAHPHIVAIHSVETTADLVFFVMEYVAGETLGARLRRTGALPGTDASRVVQEVAWALAHAHARGVIHRDVKPDNILLEEGSDRAIVTDFGIARAGVSDGAVSNPAMGTYHYMSPEQASGSELDARTDIYALGVTAFHAVTGRRPFEGYDGAALLAQQSMAEAPTVSAFAPTLQPRFAAAIDRAVRRDPGARWSSMEEFAQELAAARAIAPSLPLPTRIFAREAREQFSRAALTMTTALSTELVLLVGFGWDDFVGVVLHAIALAMLGSSLIAIGSLKLKARELLRRGYGHAAASRAIDHERAEQESQPALPMHPVFDNPTFLIAGGALITTLGVLGTKAAEGFFPGALAVVAAIMTPVAVALQLSKRWKVWHTGWATMMRGAFGRAVFRIAGIGLGHVRTAPSAGEPTALALGGVIGEIYARLPEAQRRLLSDVPDLVVRLEQLAMDRSSGDAVQAVTALETLRLDLLRLHAGEVAAESLTTDFARLRDVGRAVDAALEVRQLA